MKAADINVRDPFILTYQDKYYLYASHTGKFEGYVYVSSDLENWSEPTEIISFDSSFWATKDYWAPEVHYYNGNFYLFVSLMSETRNRGTQIFKSESPTGPFVSISDGPQTPEDWMCLDGTLYVDKKGTPYMVFCHEWVQIGNGEICYAQLSEDLSHFVTEPKVMFKAADYPFVKDIDGNGSYVTDGCFLYRNDNDDLSLIWSSFGEKGYFESVLKSDNGEIDGNWIAQPMLFEEDGGHAMIFKDFDGSLKMSLHAPNFPHKLERMKLFEINDIDGTLSIK